MKIADDGGDSENSRRSAGHYELDKILHWQGRQVAAVATMVCHIVAIECLDE